MTSILFDSVYFKEWLKHVQLEDSTKKSYVYKLRKFEQYIIDNEFHGEVLDFDSFYASDVPNKGDPIDQDFIEGFIDSQREEIPKSSLYITICALRNFFTFLHETRLIRRNPTILINNPNYSLIKKDRSLSDNECKKLLKAALLMDPFSKQWAILFLLGITCGLRASEICNLRRGQINFDRNVIFVNRGQKTKAKSVHMPSSTRRYLFAFLNHSTWLEWGKGEESKEVFFFDNSPLTTYSLKKILSEISKKAKIGREITPHQMRHTMARMMYENGLPLSVIQRQLRHKNVRNTILYLPPNPELSKILNNMETSLFKNKE